MNIKLLSVEEILSLVSRRLRTANYTVLGILESEFENDAVAIEGFAESLIELSEVLEALRGELPVSVSNSKPFTHEMFPGETEAVRS